MTSKPSIILLGLPPNHESIPADKRDAVRKMLATVGEPFEALGLKFEFVGVGPGDEGVLEKALSASKPDAVVVGFGVRGNPGLTHFFEQIINSVHELAPSAKILFNTMPDNTLDAVKRWFPIEGST